MASSKRGMRRNLTAYADEDFSLFLRRAFIKAMGYTDEALDRPIVSRHRATGRSGLRLRFSCCRG